MKYDRPADTGLEDRSEWEAAWAREADRREAQIAAGAAKWLPGSEVLDRLRKTLGSPNFAEPRRT